MGVVLTFTGTANSISHIAVLLYLFSAGVGRTGSFIAIDALYEHGQKTEYVDIMEYVQMMRKDRMNMIQTKVSFLNGWMFKLDVMDLFCVTGDKNRLKISKG